ncbi:hypothetical protein BGX26_006493, partial [Mortierella sp. AD094]
PIPKAKVNEAIRLMEAGVSVRETARLLMMSRATASRIHSANKENMQINKGGRPRKTTAEVIEHVKLNMKRGMLKTAVEAKNEANQLLPRPVSAMAIRRRLREAGLIAKRIVKQPALKKEHIHGRLQFVKKLEILMDRI